MVIDPPLPPLSPIAYKLPGASSEASHLRPRGEMNSSSREGDSGCQVQRHELPQGRRGSPPRASALVPLPMSTVCMPTRQLRKLRQRAIGDLGIGKSSPPPRPPLSAAGARNFVVLLDTCYSGSGKAGPPQQVLELWCSPLTGKQAGEEALMYWGLRGTFMAPTGPLGELLPGPEAP